MFNNKLFGRKAAGVERSNYWTFGLLLVAALTGLGASFVLTVEKIHLLEDPNSVLSCSINVVLNCTTVMKTWQSNVFGFPNMLIGMVMYPAAVSLAIFGLSKVKLPRRIMVASEIVAILGALFAYWLFFQSLYAIQVLCPWCLIVTVVTTLILAAITHYNLRENHLGLSKKWNKKAQDFVASGYDKLLVASWLFLLVALVVLKFGNALFA